MNNARNIRLELEVIVGINPNNVLLQDAIAHLSTLEAGISQSSPSKSTWAVLDNELKQLQNQGLWGTLPEQKRLWDLLAEAVKHSVSGTPYVPDISITVPPSSRGIPMVQIPTLPAEVLEQINEVYLLHTLATNPTKILPPGKSLLSLLSSRTQQMDEAESQRLKALKHQVGDAITRAFWDEALKSLSSPLPAVQLTRLRLLYIDLLTAVEPLVPTSHPIVYTLSDPLSPTSSPLRTAARHLRVLASLLRERCAPIRDEELDTVLARIQDPPLADLPQACIDTVRNILDVADRMKDDLADFVVGTWTEQDAQRWVRQESTKRERSIVLQVFSPQSVKDSYREWLGTGSEASTGHVVARLMEGLISSQPVSPFPPSSNMLPLHFLFATFDLLKVQNLLQALVITASLRSLVRPANNPGTAWLTRVWTLLEMEIERGGTEPAETKLLNLEDEVVQAARSPRDGENAETLLREAVQRILRPQDPVFMLLRSRLVGAIQGRLTEQRDAPVQTQMPVQMRTGRGKLADVEWEGQEQEQDLVVKGFEDVVLKENVTKLVGLLRGCLKWVDGVWGEFSRSDTL